LADSLPGANWPGSEKAVNHHLSPINSKQTHSSNNRFFLYYRILVAVVLVLSSCHKWVRRWSLDCFAEIHISFVWI